jgi:hypothetical protein
MRKITTIGELLAAIERTVEEDQDVSLGQVLDTVGRRSFGPFLLLAGLVMAAPGAGDIPGVPTGVGIFVALVAGQMALRRNYLWLPQALLKQTISDRQACKAIAWLRAPARTIDRIVKPRLTWLTEGPGGYVIAVACLAIALAAPAMELVLFSANVAGAAVAAFGLALIAHDGLLALIALVLTVVTAGTIVYFVL